MIIDLFCESYSSAKGEAYVIGLGKKHYYNSIERQYISNLISIYKQSKPDSDTETALQDFKKLFNTILNYNYDSPYLANVTLFKICFKLNDYKTYITNHKLNKKEFTASSNITQKADALIVSGNISKTSMVTKLPEIEQKYYTNDELDVIKDEMLRLAAARDDKYSEETMFEWIRCFSELNYSASKVVKCIRLAKLQPKYKTKEFAMFLQVDLNEYYTKYPQKK